MNYANLEQRMAHAYLDMFPPFVPLASAEVSVQLQEQFYLFMKGVYQSIFDAPELFFKQLYEDDAYPNRFNRVSYGKPKLYDHMKRDIKEIDDLLSWLFSLGQDGAVDSGKMAIPPAGKATKKYQSALPRLGLTLDHNVLSCDAFGGLFPAWKWMATRQNATALSFSRCMFDPEHSYMQDIYAALFGDEQAFGTLVQYLQESGYARFDLVRGPYTLDYAKQTVEREVPLGTPEHGDPYHYGISAQYKYDAAPPQFLVLRILDMKGMLHRFAAMSPGLQGFVIQYVKKCDDCGLCTQTDKSGKRKPLAIDVSYGGDSYRVCPLYPGFNFCFTELSEELTANLVAFLDFMDKHLSGAH